MGSCIMKLTDGADSWYLIWSTVVDAPVTHGMPLDDLREFIEHDPIESRKWPYLADSLARTEERGVSWRAPDSTIEGTIAGNRAGPNESEATREQIIQWYCRDGWTHGNCPAWNPGWSDTCWQCKAPLRRTRLHPRRYRGRHGDRRQAAREFPEAATREKRARLLRDPERLPF